MLVNGFVFFDENSSSTQSNFLANPNNEGAITVQVEALEQGAEISLCLQGLCDLSMPEDYYNIKGTKLADHTGVSTITSEGIYMFPINGIVCVRMTSNVSVGNVKVVGSIGNNFMTVRATPIIPTGNINITSTDTVDVYNYATARVVDRNLVSSNIVKGVRILGITGTAESGITPTGTFNITNNGVYDITNYANVDVNVPSQPGPSVNVNAVEKGVNFIDWNGNFVEAWESSEVASKTSLPANPTHEGAVSQGWNWTLPEIKSYINKYPFACVYVGQTYNPTSTKIYITLNEGRTAPYLGLGINGSATVDWGDNTFTGYTGSDTTVLVNYKHTYSQAGDYVITISADQGSEISILGDSTVGSKLLWNNSNVARNNRVYQNAIRKIELNSAAEEIGQYGFSGLGSLEYISLHSNVSVGANAFLRCSSLRSIVLPRIQAIPAYVMNACSCLTTISVPPTITTIDLNAFSSCSSLIDFTFPDSVTSIGQSFQSCYALRKVVISSNVTTFNEYSFYQCTGLEFVYIDSVADFNYRNIFAGCTALTSVYIKDGYSVIGAYMFNGCYSLASYDVPDSVATINTGAFADCGGLGFVKFNAINPPVAASSSVWQNLPEDCIIYVPRGYLVNYTSATNYPSSSTYTYVEY